MVVRTWIGKLREREKELGVFWFWQRGICLEAHWVRVRVGVRIDVREEKKGISDGIVGAVRDSSIL